MLRFLCRFTARVVANFSILDIYEIKGWQMYIINTIPGTWKSEISLVRFLIRQQLVDKYRTIILTLKVFYIFYCCFPHIVFDRQKHRAFKAGQ